MTTYRIPVDTCSGYNLIARSASPPDWERHRIHSAHTAHLCGADSTPLHIRDTVRLYVRIANNVYHLPFYVADKLAVPVLFGTAFTDLYIRSIDPIDNVIKLRNNVTIPILRS